MRVQRVVAHDRADTVDDKLRVERHPLAQTTIAKVEHHTELVEELEGRLKLHLGKRRSKLRHLRSAKHMRRVRRVGRRGLQPVVQVIPRERHGLAHELLLLEDGVHLALQPLQDRVGGAARVVDREEAEVLVVVVLVPLDVEAALAHPEQHARAVGSVVIAEGFLEPLPDGAVLRGARNAVAVRADEENLGTARVREERVQPEAQETHAANDVVHRSAALARLGLVNGLGRARVDEAAHVEDDKVHGVAREEEVVQRIEDPLPAEVVND
mmetsp:Transcript_33080/g.109298  ORF Transcript_33080/g.109298 Transcript_33080/m.109298 type:complete len:269 (+) Transcript_33080:333-1139(+)